MNCVDVHASVQV